MFPFLVRVFGESLMARSHLSRHLIVGLELNLQHFIIKQGQKIVEYLINEIICLLRPGCLGGKIAEAKCRDRLRPGKENRTVFGTGLRSGRYMRDHDSALDSA